MGVRGLRHNNQTVLHQQLTERTFNFLHSMCTARGLIWRDEHTLHNGMRPDAVGFCSLQQHYERLFTNTDKYECNIVPDYMFVFESKVTYSDFKNSFNGSGEWKEKPYANFHFLVLPKGFHDAYDLSKLPDYWGILEPKVSALQIIKYPKYIQIDRIFFLEAAYTILFKWGRTFHFLEKDLQNEIN